MNEPNDLAILDRISETKGGTAIDRTTKWLPLNPNLERPFALAIGEYSIQALVVWSQDQMIDGHEEHMMATFNGASK